MVEPCPSATPGALLRMSELLANITGDMAHVTRLVSDLSMQHGLELSDAQITDLQTLDRVCQSLRDLVVIAETLAAPDAGTSTTDHLQLAETRSILAPEPERLDRVMTGSIELF